KLAGGRSGTPGRPLPRSCGPSFAQTRAHECDIDVDTRAEDGVVEVVAAAVQRGGSAVGDLAGAEEREAGRYRASISGEVLTGRDRPAGAVDLVLADRRRGGGDHMIDAGGVVDRRAEHPRVGHRARGPMSDADPFGDLPYAGFDQRAVLVRE